MMKDGKGTLNTQPGEEMLNGRLSIYLGKSCFGGDVRLDIMVLGQFLMGPLRLSFHEEGSYDHVCHPVIWLRKHNDQSECKINKIVEFSVEHIMEYLHLMGLN